IQLLRHLIRFLTVFHFLCRFFSTRTNQRDYSVCSVLLPVKFPTFCV
ncbi:hypothetical protein DOY81_006174, partial [Sarcophaga bullata]